MEHTVLAQSGKAVDYLIKSSIDFQKILIDVQFQAPTPLANQPSDPNSPDVGSMDFRLMHAPRVKCPIVGRGGGGGCAAIATKSATGVRRPAPPEGGGGRGHAFCFRRRLPPSRKA